MTETYTWEHPVQDKYSRCCRSGLKDVSTKYLFDKMKDIRPDSIWLKTVNYVVLVGFGILIIQALRKHWIQYLHCSSANVALVKLHYKKVTRRVYHGGV